MTTDRFTEIEFGDLLQEAIDRMEWEQRHQKGEKIPNLINVLDAARVVVEFCQNKMYPPKVYAPRVCPKGTPEHIEYPFLCHCDITAEMIEDALARINDDRDASQGLCCFHCGQPSVSPGIYPPHPRHEDLWVRGPRAWGTVWHGSRDM